MRLQPEPGVLDHRILDDENESVEKWFLCWHIVIKGKGAEREGKLSEADHTPRGTGV